MLARQSWRSRERCRKTSRQDSKPPRKWRTPCASPIDRPFVRSRTYRLRKKVERTRRNGRGRYRSNRGWVGACVSTKRGRCDPYSSSLWPKVAARKSPSGNGLRRLRRDFRRFVRRRRAEARRQNFHPSSVDHLVLLSMCSEFPFCGSPLRASLATAPNRVNRTLR